MKKFIIVNSHRRSGTHFLIDFITSNFDETYFPGHRNLPKDLNLGSLLREDEDVRAVFLKLSERSGNIVLKNHNLHDEYHSIGTNSASTALLKNIVGNGYNIYIKRDPVSVLKSLYQYTETNLSFPDFIRARNDHFCIESPLRDKWFQSDRATYLGYHVRDGMGIPNCLVIDYAELLAKPGACAVRIADFVKRPHKKEVVAPRKYLNRYFHTIVNRLHRLGLLRRVQSTAVLPRMGCQKVFEVSAEDHDFIMENFKRGFSG